jgi:hypothetical protein
MWTVWTVQSLTVTVSTVFTRQNTTMLHSVAHKWPNAISQFNHTNTVQLFRNCSADGRKPNISERRPGISGVAHSSPPTTLSFQLSAHSITQSLALPTQSPSPDQLNNFCPHAFLHNSPVSFRHSQLFLSTHRRQLTARPFDFRRRAPFDPDLGPAVREWVYVQRREITLCCQ